MGHRPQIAARLGELGIPFVLLHDGTVKRKQLSGCERTLENVQFRRTVPAIRDQLLNLFPSATRFTHVIAGTEAAVLTASVARRVFGARRSRDTVVLRCQNKRIMKSFLGERGVPLVPHIFGRDSSRGNLTPAAIVEELGIPVVVKQLATSGGRGLSVVRSANDLIPYAHQRVIFERFVDAPEMSIENLHSGGRVIFTNTTRYVEKTRVNLVPSGIPRETIAEVNRVHAQVLKALKIDWGLTHAEYYLAPEGVYFGEVAIRPPGGNVMDLISLAYGFDAWAAFVDNELELPPKVKGSASRWAASVLFHPGEGTIKSIEGVASVESDPRCERLYLFQKAGDRVLPRVGVGQVSAYGLFSAETEADVLSAARAAQARLVFKM